MDKAFQPSQVEEKIYKDWEKKKLFRAEVNKNKNPFCIILPPPNANADLHLGHAMYVYEDIMIRYYKMRGRETLWLPGADHAGFETQFVYEKHLQRIGKSRFDYDRETLFKDILSFVMKNKKDMVAQLKRLGFALDWSKEKFTMDEDIVNIVNTTFKKLFDEGLVYREKRLINYCVRDGTSFSDLEVLDRETELKEGLFYIKYPLERGGYITVATTRPETMLGDVALMVNPKDKRYKDLIGESAILPIIGRKLPIIEDTNVDMKFGTGAVKVTPAHDETDWEVGQRHGLPQVQVIGFDGKIRDSNTHYDGMKVKDARTALVEELRKMGLFKTVKKHKLVFKTCYKCGQTLEPLPLEQWFIKVRPLTEKAKKLVEEGEIKILPSRFKKTLLDWLNNFHDWNISRQTVWGIRIPAYYCKSQNKWFVTTITPKRCDICGKEDFEQDKDTFDTWFSSAQWPFATLQTLGEDFYDYFYPTSVMETGYDILPWWVARMVMIGYYATGKEPFRTVFLHGMVRDKKGQKMSKSKGNVINPMEMIDKYGADALRASLIFGVSEGNDVIVSEEKILGMRNFANKIWNMGRFIDINRQIRNSKFEIRKDNSKIKSLESEFKNIKKQYLKSMDSYKFSMALNLVYEFLWHRLADFYIEELKEEVRNGNIKPYEALKSVYLEALKLLHPFMPFVTEAVWQVFNKNSIYETNISA